MNLSLSTFSQGIWLLALDDLFDSNFKNCISRKYRISEFRIRISRNYQTGYRQWWVTFLSKFDTRITVIELVSYLWARNLWHLCYHSNLYYSIFVKSELTPEASKDIGNNRLIQMLKEVHKQEGMKNDIKIGWCDDKICYIYYKKYPWFHIEPKLADSYVWTKIILWARKEWQIFLWNENWRSNHIKIHVVLSHIPLCKT